MTKYKIVGFFNILFGLIYFFVPLIYLLLVVPKLAEIYKDFSVKPDFLIVYLTGGFSIILGLLSLLLGFKLFSSEAKNKQKYFTIALILLLLVWILGGIITSFLVLSVLLPIYNLTSQF